MRKPFKFNLWTTITIGLLLLYILFLIYPLFHLLLQSIIDKDNGNFTLIYFEKFFGREYYFGTLLNSFQVTIWITIISVILATPLAYFFTRFEIKGKKLLRVIIILSSMSAPFIGAYSWILLLGRNGVITQFISQNFGLTMPNIYGFTGILLVLSLQLYPLIFLYVSGALNNVDNSLLEASENLGCSGIKRFLIIVIPLVMPTLIAGGLLVFMRSFADFGTPMLIGEGYRTFPVTIFNEYISELGGDDGFAAAISLIAILITTFIFLIQQYIASRKSFKMNSINKIRPVKIKGITNLLVHLYTYVLVGVSIMPQLYIYYTSFKKTNGTVFTEGFSFDSYIEAFDKVGNTIYNTMMIPGISLIFIIGLAVLIAYVSIRRNNVFTKVLDTVSMIPFILPGSVVGITLLIAFNKPPMILSGTLLIMVVALIIRRLPYTIRSSAAILQQIPVTTEEAALSLGASKLKTFVRITMPMMAAGIISGAILSWITMISELATAILLYTGRTKTLTIEIYTQVIRGNYGIAAAYATILALLTIVSLMVFNKISKGNDISI